MSYSDEVVRLKRLISKFAHDAQEHQPTAEELQDAIARLHLESINMVRCACGSMFQFSELTWRDWTDISLKVSECKECGSTVSRSM